MNVGVIFQPTNKRAAPTTDRALNSRVLLLHLMSWSELLRLTGPFLFVSRGKLLRLTRPFLLMSRRVLGRSLRKRCS